MKNIMTKVVHSYDDRRNLALPGGKEETLNFCVEHFIGLAQSSIASQGYFAVALSGGSTPKAIFQKLANAKNRDRIQWQHVLLFWSDERCVPPDHPESNYRMAMETGFATLNIPAENIFRLKGESDPESAAKNYDLLLLEEVPQDRFDLIMLGMGADGHTASLFPKTAALHTTGRMVTANYVPQMQTWRLTMTYECINASKNIAIYVMGEGKADTAATVLTSPKDIDTYPIQNVGTTENKALWILDSTAATKLPK